MEDKQKLRKGIPPSQGKLSNIADRITNITLVVIAHIRLSFEKILVFIFTLSHFQQYMLLI